MSEIHLPHHLIIAFCVAALLLFIMVVLRNSISLTDNRKWFLSGAIIFLVIYLLLLGSALYLDVKLHLDLLKFDLDKNGTYNGNEITPEYKLAMTKVISDVGRNFAFINGLFYSAIITSIIGLASYLYKKVTTLKANKR